ncbi:lytic transglycosylase domain-containing protein [Sphingobium yanoikuyae]|uniref:Murein transglycosylase n=1 Tax=Sphingobium yanoikuyae TaxID=13690 RepID=A0A291MY56_SPHYA|nr:lytic transglycosylase domain-containing protein [Sphingobium yanoikuyae]ATI79828.1 murein transglycosylase [Sphingobium yanoikuyae]
MALASIATSGAVPVDVHAASIDADQHEERIGRCIKSAAGGSRWLERTLWGLRDQEGGQIGTVSRNRDGSEDLGPMQINSWWLTPIARALHRDRWQVRNWLISDPCFNVQAARWIFVSGLQARKDYWGAIGIYHSPNEARQRRYARLVAKKLEIRFGGAKVSGKDGLLLAK